jgi:hypothetical protein
MDDSEFFLTIWKLLALVLITIVLSISGCVSFQNYQISKAIEHGVDPMNASCAFSAFNDSKSVCTIIATKN